MYEVFCYHTTLSASALDINIQTLMKEPNTESNWHTLKQKHKMYLETIIKK
jgi:hypothetical protein